MTYVQYQSGKIQAFQSRLMALCYASSKKGMIISKNDVPKDKLDEINKKFL